MKKVLSLALALTMMVSLAACGAKKEEAPAAAPAASAPASTAEKVYAVEAGSAGEAAALDAGYSIISVETQAAALMEVAAGTSDAAIIDSLMAGAMVGEGTSYPDLKCTDEKLTEELYGVACRKGSNLAAYINSVFAEAYADGIMQDIATTYGVQEALVEQTSDVIDLPTDGDVAYIVDKGTLIVGITDFAPMDYKDDKGEWIGFDADMARIVAEKMGVEIEFIEINWDNKVFELDGKAIDVVWNGMTLTDAMLEAAECSTAYCNNAQVVVTK